MIPLADSHVYLLFNPWSGDNIYGGLGSMFGNFREMIHCLTAVGENKVQAVEKVNLIINSSFNSSIHCLESSA